MRCPAEKTDVIFWDASCRGFGIRALSSGRRSWIFQYRDEHQRTRRIALGDVSAVSLEAARAAARHHAATVTQGGNPSLQRKVTRRAASVLDIAEAYLQYAKTRQRLRSYKETERHLLRHAASLHQERVEAVQRRDVAALLDRVNEESGPIAANRVRAALSALWTWGLRTGRIDADSNPVGFTIRQPEKSRERILSDSEIDAIWKATGVASDYSRIVRLCLLTGCRRDEIGHLRWDEIEDDHLLIGAKRMKGGATHEIPMLPMIAAALPSRPKVPQDFLFGRRGTGFSGWSKSKKALDAEISKAGLSLAPWGLHDLRRTFSTRLHDTGVEPIVVEALLAHKQQGVAAVYNRASFRGAKRAALERWHSILKNMMGLPLP
jgi:integrase